MKKILIVLFLIGFISPAFAFEYKAETPQTINKLLQQFYQEEQGNRLSSFAIQSLAAQIQNVFSQNIVMEDSNATKTDKAY